MIDSIQVEGFKSIRSQSVSLHPMNIIIGGNGVGKSNFLSIFEFLRMIIQLRDFEYSYSSDSERLLYMGRKTTDKVRFSFHFDGDWLNMLSIELKDVNDKLRVRGLYVDEKESVFPAGDYSPEVAAERLRMLVNQFWVHHFQDTGNKSPYRNASRLSDDRFLRADGSNLASVLFRIRRTDAKLFKRIEDIIHQVTPSFRCFDLRPDGVDGEMIRLQWHPAGEDALFDQYQLSDGTLRMMSIVTLLFQPELPNPILIDEPEIGLHPASISILADLLKKAARKTQVVLSTQSIDLINHFTPEDIIVCDYKQNQSIFKRLNSDELRVWLNDFTLGEIWEKNIFGGQPY